MQASREQPPFWSGCFKHPKQVYYKPIISWRSLCTFISSGGSVQLINLRSNQANTDQHGNRWREWRSASSVSAKVASCKPLLPWRDYGAASPTPQIHRQRINRCLFSLSLHLCVPLLTPVQPLDVSILSVIILFSMSTHTTPSHWSRSISTLVF